MRIVVHEEGTRSVLEVSGPPGPEGIRIGRAIDNEIRLSNPLVSRHHCRLELDDGSLAVVDLESANGTQVNGVRVSRAQISTDDEVQVGSARLTLEIDPVTGVSEPTIVPGSPEALEEEPGLSTLLGAGRPARKEIAAFASITRALLLETELAPLLRVIVDTAVELVRAERGFILLRDTPSQRPAQGAEALDVRVARHFDRSDIPVPRSRLSLGIASQVIAERRGVLSVDAARDERFGGMQSVEDLRLRSVMCVPVVLGDAVEGVLYLDNRLQESAFEHRHLELLQLFGDQAALAIRNARFVGELRARNDRLLESSRQVERLNSQLGRKVKDRDSQLAVARRELSRERGRYDYTQIVGASDGMARVFHELDRIIESELPVLIHGESGTGKELIARAIHFNGGRKERPFVAENCAALPDTLLESELFGHARGAFTGAERSKKGLVEQADGGTLFLDEIGDMSTEMQKKLLRVLQEGEVRPLGSDRVVKVNVRLLAASHRQLEQMVREGEFREDLFYRINVLTVHLPALRERRDDVPLLAEALVARAAREAGCTAPELTHEVIAALAAYDWPGNVRELENEMRRVVVLAEDTVRLEHLSKSVLGGGDGPASPTEELRVDGDLRQAVARFEMRAIEAALQRAQGNKSRAAAELGISRFALQRKLEKYGLLVADDDPNGPS